MYLANVYMCYADIYPPSCKKEKKNAGQSSRNYALSLILAEIALPLLGVWLVLLLPFLFQRLRTAAMQDFAARSSFTIFHGIFTPFNTILSGLFHTQHYVLRCKITIRQITPQSKLATRYSVLQTNKFLRWPRFRTFKCFPYFFFFLRNCVKTQQTNRPRRSFLQEHARQMRIIVLFAAGSTIKWKGFRMIKVIL